MYIAQYQSLDTDIDRYRCYVKYMSVCVYIHTLQEFIYCHQAIIILVCSLHTYFKKQSLKGVLMKKNSYKKQMTYFPAVLIKLMGCFNWLR